MESLIEEFGLSHIRKSRGDFLSGGERRRTEIARALATSDEHRTMFPLPLRDSLAIVFASLSIWKRSPLNFSTDHHSSCPVLSIMMQQLGDQDSWTLMSWTILRLIIYRYHLENSSKSLLPFLHFSMTLLLKLRQF